MIRCYTVQLYCYCECDKWTVLFPTQFISSLKMCKISAIFILVTVLLHNGQCQFGGAFDFTSPDDIYLRHYWNWRSHTGPGQIWPPRAAHPERRDTEIPDPTDERDREPLAPDYRDPETIPDPDEPAQIPNTGVIDVDSNGYPSGLVGGFGGFPEGGYGGLFNIFGSLRRRKPWWEGPNVCVEREETVEDEDKDNKKSEGGDNENNEDDDNDDEDDDVISSTFLSSINLSTCRETFNKYECITRTNNRGVIKTFTVKYRCCHGFRRTSENPTCSKLELKPVLETIEELRANEFRKMISSSGLDENLAENNITVFVPTDQALNDFTEKMLEMNQVEIEVDPVRRRRRDIRHALSTRDLTLNHVISEVIDLTDVGNEEIFNSEFNNSTIRINIYPTTTERLITANCVPIRKANNFAENGIVHVIDGVITPGQFTIKKIIEESKKLHILKKILQNPKLEKLLQRKGPFTFLAPTDEAFEKLDEGTRQKLSRGDECAVNILKYHIIPHSICSPAIIGNVTVHNIEGNLFNLERKENDDVIIEENVKIVKHDIIATDGVIHLVDTLMLPESGLHVTQALKKHNLTIFEQLIEDANLVEELDSIKNATIFVPTDEALEKEESKKLIEELKADKTKLKNVIMYHILPGKVQSCDLNNNEMQETGLEGEKLRVNLYSTLPLFSNVINRGTVNCAKLVDVDEKSCGSVVHTVDRLLVPPKQSILEMVNSNEKYSILSKIIKDTEVEKVLKDDKQSITLLAPTDEVFEKVEEKVLNTLLENKEKADEVLKHHILSEVLCCSGVGGHAWSFNSYVPTLAHHAKEIRRNNRQQIRIGKTTVTNCDTIATNGVIHEVNSVMFPSKHQYTIPGFGSLFMFEF